MSEHASLSALRTVPVLVSSSLGSRPGLPGPRFNHPAVFFIVSALTQAFTDATPPPLPRKAFVTMPGIMER